MTLSRFRGIPAPAPGNVLQVLEAIKQNMEILTGQRGSARAPMIYHQDETPTDAVEGDLWIQASARKLVYFNGRTWEAQL